MKVELSIKDDSELRNMIKDLIKGQVTNIVREEVKQILSQALEKRVVASVGQATGVIERELKTTLNQLLGVSIGYGSAPGKSVYLEKLVSDKIDSLVRESVNVVVQRKTS